MVPAKLVKQIRKGEFMDMAELLKDNMDAERRAAAESSLPLMMGRASKREIPDILSWLMCFSSYAAVVSRDHPKKVRKLWAYQAIMIAESRRCGGRGRSLYDSAFRQQMAT